MSTASPMTHYKFLRLEPTATLPEINAACRKVSTQTHPDNNGSAAHFTVVIEVRRMLSDTKLRASYDRSVKGPAPAPAGPAPSARSGSGSGHELR